MVDNKPTPGLKSYGARARAFREQEIMAVHQRNLARSASRGAQQWRTHDVERRWNASPALLKARPGDRPASAVGLTPQTHTRTLVRAEDRVAPKSTLAKRLGGSEDLIYELGGEPTPLAHLRTPSRPPSVKSRTEQLSIIQNSTIVRLGLTHRERAVLWGTSLDQYQQIVDVDEVDSTSTMGTGRRKRRPRSAQSNAFGSGAGGDSTAAEYQYYDHLRMVRERVLNAIISDRRQRTDEGVLKEAEAAWKTVPARRQDAKLASTLCCLMRDLGVERGAIDAFFSAHCSKSERDRMAATEQPQQQQQHQCQDACGHHQQSNMSVTRQSDQSHLDRVASVIGLGSHQPSRNTLQSLRSTSRLS